MRGLVLVLGLAGVCFGYGSQQPMPAFLADGKGSEEFLRRKCAVGEVLDLRWTFGNHEPIAMYRRIGRKTTGGIEGSALWLEDWHRWYDSRECTRRMKGLGLNILHSRFYKGMGWEAEKEDFPRVKAFVENCHADGVKALAYVQFATLYYETMLAEIPDLENWAAKDETGKTAVYHSRYFRWMPCITCEEYRGYLERMTEIALKEGKFDGVMYDNAFTTPCYCARCERKFREHLKGVGDVEARFGMKSLAHARLPRTGGRYGEVQDPLAQECVKWRAKEMTEFFGRLYRCAKRANPRAIVSANVLGLRRMNNIGAKGTDIPALAGVMDLFVAQSLNNPGMRGETIVNRVRDFRLAEELGMPILALCDSDAIDRDGGNRYLLPLVEDAVWGGIPTDRTIMTPGKGGEFADAKTDATRRPLLERFNAFVREHRAALKGKTHKPVRVFYPVEEIKISETNYRGVMAAEEILLRNKVPYGLAMSVKGKPLPDDMEGCEALVVADQRCLSGEQVEAILGWAKRGGKVVATGSSGRYDGLNRQRRKSPLGEALAGLGNARVREGKDEVPMKGLTARYEVGRPADGGAALMADLAAVGADWGVRLEGAADEVFMEVKDCGGKRAVHLVNYDTGKRVKGARLSGLGGVKRVRFCEALGEYAGWRELEIGGGKAELPEFGLYALVELEAAGCGRGTEQKKEKTK